MVGFFVALIFLGFAVATGKSQVASSPTNTPVQSATPAPTSGGSSSSTRFELLRKAFDQFSPEQQERMIQNLRRWQELSADEREVLRQRERVQRQKQEASITEAYVKS